MKGRMGGWKIVVSWTRYQKMMEAERRERTRSKLGYLSDCPIVWNESIRPLLRYIVGGCERKARGGKGMK